MAGKKVSDVAQAVIRALPSEMQTLVGPPARGRPRSTRDLMESDLSRTAHQPTEAQLTHFLILVADGVRPAEALVGAKITRAGFEAVMRASEPFRARYEEAQLTAIYKDIDLETVEDILAEIASGKYLKDCLAERFISETLWYKLALKDPVVKDMYAEARRIQAEVWADDMRELSANQERDVIESERISDTGLTVTERRPNGAAVQRDKLKVDSLKFLMAKYNPDRYGERQKIDLEANVTIDYASRLESARRRKESATIVPKGGK